PGSTTWRAMTSASTTAAPRSASRLDTVDLPAPMPPVSPITSMGGGPYHRHIAADPYSPDPAERLEGARAQGRRARRALLERAGDQWPPYSPGAVNAWLLLVTTKPPAWKDDLV